MDNSTLNSQNNFRQKKDFLNSPLGVIVELFFVCTLSGVCLFTLSYFKIIHFSSLPLIQPTTNLSPAAEISTQKGIIVNELKTILAPQYINTSTINTGKFAYDAQKQLYTFILNPRSTDPKSSINIESATRIYNSSTMDTTVRFGVTDDLQKSLTKTDAQKIITTNFSNFPQNTTFSCVKDTSLESCTTATKVANQKIQIKIYRIPAIPGQLFYLYCTVNSNSPLYNTTTYCLL